MGLALSPIHNKFLTDLVTTDSGEVLLFVPSLGYLLVIMGTGMFLLHHWDRVKGEGLGDRRIWIPLLVIVAAMGLSGAVNGDSLQDKVSPLFMGLILFSLYLVSRILGGSLFKVLVPFVIIGSVSVIVSGLIAPGQYTGGFITNYCAAAGYLIFGSLVYQGKWKWALLLVAGVGLFFIGALEAVFIVGVLGIALIVRRDFSKRLLVVCGAVLVLMAVWTGLGYLVPLYEGNQNLAVLRDVVTGQVPLDGETMAALTSGRWYPILDAVRNFSFTGHGYSLSTVGGGIVHNMPLIIMHQIGPFAALAWVFVSLYCTVKTKWKYAWIAVLAMGVWDHYIWTQFAPYWWVLIGVSTTSTIKSDLLFRREA